MTSYVLSELWTRSTVLTSLPPHVLLLPSPSLIAAGALSETTLTTRVFNCQIPFGGLFRVNGWSWISEYIEPMLRTRAATINNQHHAM